MVIRKAIAMLYIWTCQIIYRDRTGFIPWRQVVVWTLQSPFGIGFVRNMGSIYCLDGYNFYPRKQRLKKAVITGHMLCEIAQEKLGVKEMYCYFTESEYKILLLMSRLGFKFQRAETCRATKERYYICKKEL